MAEDTWKTAITEIGPGNIRVRGYHITDIMEKLTYAQAVYLILKGELPTQALRRVCIVTRQGALRDRRASVVAGPASSPG